MTTKIYGKPTFDGKTIPIALIADSESIRAAQNQSRTRKDLAVGLMLGGPKTADHYRSSCIVAPYELVIRLLTGTARATAHIEEKVGGLRDKIIEMDSLDEQLAALKRVSAGTLFKYEMRDKIDGGGRWTAEQLWSATIIGWAIHHPSEKYWSGGETLWTSFMRWLGVRVDDAQGLSPFRETYAKVAQIEKSLFGMDRTDLYMELGAWIRMDTDYKEKMAQLESLGDLYESYAKLWITLILMLATLGSSTIIKVAGDVLDGIIDIVTELEKAHRDDKVTVAEGIGIAISGVFTILPLSALLKDGKIKSIARSIELNAYLNLIALLIFSILRELFYSLGVLQRRKAAKEHKIASLEEVALDQWIVVQYTD